MVVRDGVLIMVDDERMPLVAGEQPAHVDNSRASRQKAAVHKLLIIALDLGDGGAWRLCLQRGEAGQLVAQCHKARDRALKAWLVISHFAQFHSARS